MFGCDIEKLLWTETIDLQCNAIKIEYKLTPVDFYGFYSDTQYTNFQKITIKFTHTHSFPNIFKYLKMLDSIHENVIYKNAIGTISLIRPKIEIKTML